jgi:hypothetical protein
MIDCKCCAFGGVVDFNCLQLRFKASSSVDCFNLSMHLAQISIVECFKVWSKQISVSLIIVFCRSLFISISDSLKELIRVFALSSVVMPASRIVSGGRLK